MVDTAETIENEKENIKQENVQGVSLKKLNYFMSAMTLIISAVLLIFTYMTASRYTNVEENTENYIDWQQAAQSLQSGSDYLTEQVRQFAVTGVETYMDNYFTESTETRQREAAIETLEESLSGTESFMHLQNAMAFSEELMDREYYSMRLKAEAIGMDLDGLHGEIRAVELSAEDSALDGEGKSRRAEMILFDSTYSYYKDNISHEVRLAISSLADFTEENISDEFTSLSRLLFIQQMLIIVLVVVILLVILLTSLQVIRPLIKAVPNIKDEKPLPVNGAYEYKYLAKTYNKMYEANKKQKKLLNYEATHDALTGVFNRMGYERIVSSIELYNYAVLMIDLDNFKKVNDTYGHDAGDRVLMEAVSAFKRSFRSNDLICRIGGDEFVIFMNGVDNCDDTKNLIIDKVATINDELQRIEYHDTPVSISAGGAFAEDEKDPELVVKKADMALYNTKKHGKRGCKFYDEIADIIE